MEPAERQALLEKATKILRSKRCVFSGLSECGGEIISAHTIPKCLGLKEIAENGHVYSYDLKPYPNSGKRGMAKIGVNQVSTFNFACKKHDNDLFESIESEDLEINDVTARLFFLRSMAQEIYEGDNQKELMKLLQVMQTDAIVAGIEAKESDNAHYFKMAKSPDMDIYYCCLNYDEKLPFLATTGHSPFLSIHGETLFESTNVEEVAPVIVINVFNHKEKGRILFSWPTACNGICGQFVHDILLSRSITDLILNFLFVSTQNLIVNCAFFENLPAETRDLLIDIYRFNNDPGHPFVESLPTITFGLPYFKSITTNSGGIRILKIG